MPEDDPEEDIVDAIAAGDRLDAEGQSFIIHYRDSKGEASERWITVRSVQSSFQGVPRLVALCHRRKALRAFRVDRITHIFDHDGASVEPLDVFYRDTFGFRWPAEVAPLSRTSVTVETDPERWKLIRRMCRTFGLPLLVLLALSDGDFGRNEVNVISEHVRSLMMAEGVDLSEDEADRLDAFIRRTRPADTAVKRSIERLIESGEAAIVAFMRAGMKLIAADGAVDPREADALTTLYRAMTGRSFS